MEVLQRGLQNNNHLREYFNCCNVVVFEKEALKLAIFNVVCTCSCPAPVQANLNHTLDPANFKQGIYLTQPNGTKIMYLRSFTGSRVNAERNLAFGVYLPS